MLEPCLGALQRQRLVVDRKLVDEKLATKYEVREVANAEDADSSLPHATALFQRVPLHEDGEEWLRFRNACSHVTKMIN